MAAILEWQIAKKKKKNGFTQEPLWPNIDTITLSFSSFHILLFSVTKAIFTDYFILF